MILIATGDAELAMKIGTFTSGRKTYAVSEEGPKELRHRIHAAQPAVVVLDVRFGGNRYRVIDAVPSIMDVRSGPAVVIVSPRFSSVLKRTAAKLGCFDLISLSDPSLKKKFVRCLLDAQAAYLSGAFSRPLPRALGSLH